MAIAGYTALIGWIALIAIEADPLGDVPEGPLTVIVTVVWLGGSLVVGFVGRRWGLIGLPAAITAIGLVYAAFETHDHDLPGYVENEAWAVSLLVAFTLEVLLLAAGIAIGRRRQRA